RSGTWGVPWEGSQFVGTGAGREHLRNSFRILSHARSFWTLNLGVRLLNNNNRGVPTVYGPKACGWTDRLNRQARPPTFRARVARRPALPSRADAPQAQIFVSHLDGDGV